MALAVGYDADGLDKVFESLKLDVIADYGPLGELDIPHNLLRLHGATRGKASTSGSKNCSRTRRNR